MHTVFQIIVFAFAALWFANVFRLGTSPTKLMYGATEGALLALAVRVFFAAAIGMTLALAMNRPIFDWSNVSVPMPMQIVGAACATSGEVLFVWVIAILGRNYSTSLVIQERHTLVVRGPYRYARHPMYTAFSLYFAGVSLMSGNIIVAVSGALALVVTMVVRTPKEEAMMLEYFGDDYRAYMRITNRYIPGTLPSTGTR